MCLRDGFLFLSYPFMYRLKMCLRDGFLIWVYPFMYRLKMCLRDGFLIWVYPCSTEISFIKYIAMQTNIKLQISHHKIRYPQLYNQIKCAYVMDFYFSHPHLRPKMMVQLKVQLYWHQIVAYVVDF